MVQKVIGALILIAAIAIFLTIREEGKEKAFGGVLKPLETVRNPAAAHDTTGVLITGNSVPGGAQTDYGRLVDRVRTKVNSAMDKSVRRSSRY